MSVRTAIDACSELSERNTQNTNGCASNTLETSVLHAIRFL